MFASHQLKEKMEERGSDMGKKILFRNFHCTCTRDFLSEALVLHTGFFL